MDLGIWGFQKFQESEVERDRRARAFEVGNMNDADYKEKERTQRFLWWWRRLSFMCLSLFLSFFLSYLPHSPFSLLILSICWVILPCDRSHQLSFT